MIYNTKKFTILSFLFAFVTLTSCIDDDLLPCVDNKNGEVEGYTDGYAINLTVTLDKMGGRRAQTVGQLEDIENYIDPEKFRILFFDHNDKFLFESKSRWVKQLSPSGDGAEWLISVPMYTIGNDEEYNWEWDSIRTALTTDSFKIAILANRPGQEWCPNMKDTNITETWFDNTGPHWGREQTSWFAKKNGGKAKDVFDLHHSQFDPIYTGKSWSSSHKYSDKKKGFYEFIMEKGGAKGSDYDSLYMSSTSSWVEWKDNDKNNREERWDSLRWFIPPTQDHPIPMYGIQKFKPITNWIKGTPFNLSNLTGNQPDSIYDFRSISLLRSVVKLELIIPKSKDYRLDYVVMFYPNIYARCEPMDVWTPTDQIWQEDHDECRDWENINTYGPVARGTDSNSFPNGDNSKDYDANAPRPYQQRMSWFYGAWLDKEWNFAEHGFTGSVGGDAPQNLNDSTHYPRIFNSCVQRNAMVFCGEEVDFSDEGDNGYYRYVVYTGERDINDPSYLDQLGRYSSGAPTVCYWAFQITNIKEDGTDGTRTYYAVPLTNYEGVVNDENGPAFITEVTDKMATAEVKNHPGKYGIPGNSWVNMNNYEKEVMKIGSAKPKPWPLIRNHVYRITIKGGPSELNESKTWDFTDIESSLSQVRLDDKWKPNEKSETKVFSWNEASISNNVATWNDGSTIMIMNSDKKQSSGDDITINGTKRKTIKVSNGAQNKLTLNGTAEYNVTRRITLHSYVSSSAINYPTSNNNIAIVSGGTATINKDNINFANNGTKNGVILTIENRGFKKGDRIEITGKISKGEKRGCVEIYAKINGEYILVDKTNDFSTTASKEIHILAQDADDLCLARNGDTGTQITLLKVFRNSYWKEINRDIAANEFKAFSSSDTPDKRIYPLANINNTYTATNSVTFTNTGEQVGYVMFVDVEKNDNKNLWRFENPNGELKANGQAIEALKDLKFSGSSIYLYEPDTQNNNKTKIRLQGDKSTITFPNLKEGSTITIVGQSANHDVADRGIKPVQNYLVFDSEKSDPQLNGQCIFVGKRMSGAVNDGVYTFKWTVKDCGSDDFVPVQFELIKGGIDFYEFHIETPSTTNRAAISDDSGNNKPNIRIKSEKLYSKNI